MHQRDAAGDDGLHDVGVTDPQDIAEEDTVDAQQRRAVAEGCVDPVTQRRQLAHQDQPHAEEGGEDDADDGVIA